MPTTASTKRALRRAESRKIQQSLHKHAVIWDKNLGGTNAVEWRARKSGGFSVMQAITDPGMSQLERRSLEHVQPSN